MAEITTNTRLARVDMTPMVDLGFLLITFFMFTTVFSKPFVMKLSMPYTKGKPPIMKESNTLTLILGKDDKVFWHQKAYDKLESTSLNETRYGLSLRTLILQKMKNAKSEEKFTVMIKPTDQSNYKNAVDALDEMAITNQKIYLLADITPHEKQVYEARLKP
jgi:biopolymer transport protein ExbD